MTTGEFKEVRGNKVRENKDRGSIGSKEKIGEGK